MENPLKNYAIVTDIAGDYALVKTENYVLANKLEDLGFNLNTNGFFEKLNKNQNDRIHNIEVLIRMGALFSSGKDWSPEELLNYYKEIDLIHSSYKTISWKMKNDYIIRIIE